jgi:hypothetical protein
LVGERTEEAGGAAFQLSRPATRDAVLPIEGAEIEIRNRQPYVVVRFAGPRDASTAFAKGHKFAQQGLDLLCVLGTHDAVIHDAEDEHLLWWTEPAGLVLRLVSTASLKFAVGVTLTVRDKDGNLVPPAPSHPRHHIAFRYYRLAQTTDDLFDAYRNMYLAFEVLLSCQHPKSKGEKEVVWLRRALRAATNTIKLGDLGVIPVPDLVESVVDTVYRDARLPLFHAKEGKGYFAPQDSALTRQVVSRALDVLTHIVLRMIEAWYDVRRMGGGVFLGRVYETATAHLAECNVYATSYEGPFDPGEHDLSHPRFQTAAKLHSRLAPELQRGPEPALLAAANGADLSSVNPVRRIEVVKADHPYITQIPEAALELEGVARFEVLTHVRAMNLNQPRSLFRK